MKKTKRQKELSPAERRKNLEGAFALAKPGQMKYCRILLVGDFLLFNWLVVIPDAISQCIFTAARRNVPAS